MLRGCLADGQRLWGMELSTGERTQETNATASNDGGQGACFHISHGAAACGQGTEDIANHLEIRGVGLSSMSIRTITEKGRSCRFIGPTILKESVRALNQSNCSV